MSIFDKILEARHEFVRETHGFLTPTHLLVSRAKMREIMSEANNYTMIYDAANVFKSPQYANMEIVEVNPVTHPEDYMEIVGKPKETK